MTLFNRLVKWGLYPANEWREGTRVLPGLRVLQRMQFASAERLHEFRLRKLRALLDHAFSNTVFYRRRFEEAGITPADIRDFDDLRRLPPLEKADLVRHQEELLAGNLGPGDRHRTTTGGSTGTHTPFYRDNRCLDIKLAAQYRFNRWCGWDVGRKVAVLWPALQDLQSAEGLKHKLRHLLIDRHQMFYIGQLDEAVMARLAGKLQRFSPTLIRAFPFALAIFAQYLRDATRCRIRPRGLLSTGEPLLESHRALFEEVFGCPAFNCYASRECGHVACECEAHQGMHVSAECLHVEYERDGRAVRPGQPGELLITDFENYGMPFIRYRAGDVGIPLAGTCPCGRALPRMDFAAGRVTDFLLSPHDGSLVTGTICHELAAEGPDVGQLQIIQDARDHLTIRVKRSANNGSQEIDTSHIENVIEQVFHGSMRVSFEPVAVIPREKSGKYRACINRYLEVSPV